MEDSLNDILALPLKFTNKMHNNRTPESTITSPQSISLEEIQTRIKALENGAELLTEFNRIDKETNSAQPLNKFAKIINEEASFSKKINAKNRDLGALIKDYFNGPPS